MVLYGFFFFFSSPVLKDRRAYSMVRRPAPSASASASESVGDFSSETTDPIGLNFCVWLHWHVIYKNCSGFGKILKIEFFRKKN